MQSIKKQAKQLTYDGHIIWNPWIGCKRISEGCKNCLVYTKLNINSIDEIKFNKKDFYLPVRKTRVYNETFGKHLLEYKIKPGSIFEVCVDSDFFLEDADYYRRRAWKIIQERSDCLFIITTKRIDRFLQTIPDTWTKQGWSNVYIKVSVENQMYTDYRIQTLLRLPIKHKGIEIAPILSSIDIRKYLSTGQIDEVIVSGEICNSKRLCRLCSFEDVMNIKEQCELYDVKFTFKHTGTYLYKDDKIIHINEKDGYSLASFYNIDNTNKVFDWKVDSEELEDIQRIEQAAIIRKKLEIEGLG